MGYKVVVFNGPPASGKDVIANSLVSLYPNIYEHLTFKQPLVERVKEIFGISDDEWEDMYSREMKEVPQERLGNRSPRQALGFVAEDLIKPLAGDGIFALEVCESITKTKTNPSKVFIISDGGFEEELVQVSLHFYRPLLIRIHRDGKDFTNDRRGWLTELPIDFYEYDLINAEGRFTETVNKCHQIIENHFWR